MKLTQVLTRSSLAAIALLNLSNATSAVADPIVVTRGPNGPKTTKAAIWGRLNL